MSDQTKYVADPLPKTVIDLLKQRKGKFEKTMNDMVEELYLKLWENPQFKGFLEAVTDGEAKEGSLACDDHEAARMLRDLARKEGNAAIKEKPLASFKLSLKIVMRRYHASRKERKHELGGELVSPENNED